MTYQCAVIKNNLIEYLSRIRQNNFFNLEYKIHGGYLTAGDYWKKGVSTAKIDDMYTLYHALTITF